MLIGQSTETGTKETQGREPGTVSLYKWDTLYSLGEAVNQLFHGGIIFCIDCLDMIHQCRRIRIHIDSRGLRAELPYE